MTDNELGTSTLIAALRNQIAELEHRLDMSEKWGKAMAARWSLITDAIAAGREIRQEESPNPNFGIRP